MNWLVCGSGLGRNCIHTTYMWKHTKSSWQQPEAAERTQNPITKNSLFSHAQKWVTDLATDYAPVGFKPLQVSSWLQQGCEYALANCWTRNIGITHSSDTMDHPTCWREHHVWVSLNKWTNHPIHQQNWSNKFSKIVQILCNTWSKKLRHLLSWRIIQKRTFEISYVDISSKMYFSFVRAQPVTRQPWTFQTSGINAHLHVNTYRNCY